MDKDNLYKKKSNKKIPEKTTNIIMVVIIAMLIICFVALLVVFIKLKMNNVTAKIEKKMMKKINIAHYYNANPINIDTKLVLSFKIKSEAQLNDLKIKTNGNHFHFVFNETIKHFQYHHSYSEDENSKHNDEPIELTKLSVFDDQIAQFTNFNFITSNLTDENKGSDNSIDGKQFDGEVQLYLRSQSNNTQYYRISIFLEVDDNNKFNLVNLEKTKKETSITFTYTDLLNELTEKLKQIYKFKIQLQNNLVVNNIICKSTLKITTKQLERIKNFKSRNPLKIVDFTSPVFYVDEKFEKAVMKKKVEENVPEAIDPVSIQEPKKTEEVKEEKIATS
ncbi:hypothetical protein A3Q56_05206 [Intoshia linei]|uniref:Uncharacterized protein n=1 Tax=Intoshia linei TaxID=1819745 RepID=A0A177B0V1_9BILA|nr:hypothetical protein A3Q56_05206 [Intoshia linei]